MINYLYYQHEGEMEERFSAKEETEEYETYGENLWRIYIRLLIRSFNIELSGSVFEELLSDIRGMFPEDDIQYIIQSMRESPVTLGEWVLTILLEKLKSSFPPLSGKRRCPRLFISHRQTDTSYALGIATIAAHEGFAYWVDVLDPNLQSLPGMTHLSPRMKSLLTACIIEMALINCTHVIACLTPASRGSLWLPYEYGRITRMPGRRHPAAAWVHFNLSTADFPEYMYLGVITQRRNDIVQWLTAEKRFYSSSCNRHIQPPSFYLSK